MGKRAHRASFPTLFRSTNLCFYNCKENVKKFYIKFLIRLNYKILLIALFTANDGGGKISVFLFKYIRISANQHECTINVYYNSVLWIYCFANLCGWFLQFVRTFFETSSFTTGLQIINNASQSIFVFSKFVNVITFSD